MMLRQLTRLVLPVPTWSIAAGITSCSSSNSSASKAPVAESTPSGVSKSPVAEPSSSPVTSAPPQALKDLNKPATTLSVESSISSNLFLPKGITVSSLDCPNDIQVKAGSTFDCQAVSDQVPFKVGVTVENEKGDMDFKTKGLLILPPLEKLLPEKVKQQNNVEVTADCGSKKSNIRTFKAVGESFQCDLLKEGSKAGVATVTVTGENGAINATWEL